MVNRTHNADVIKKCVIWFMNNNIYSFVINFKYINLVDNDLITGVDISKSLFSYCLFFNNLEERESRSRVTNRRGERRRFTSSKHTCILLAGSLGKLSTSSACKVASCLPRSTCGAHSGSGSTASRSPSEPGAEPCDAAELRLLPSCCCCCC